MIRTIAALLSCLLLALFSGPLHAGPIPPLPTPVSSAGESLLTSFITGPASSVNVDWEVITTDETGFAPGLYAYLYQIENTSTSGVDAFSVTIPAPAFASIVAAGNLGGDDLDNITAFHPAHTAVFFPILATEQDPFPLQAVGAATALNGTDDTVTWTFPPLAQGSQSDTLYFLSTKPPVYGNAVAQDSIPPSPWGSLAAGAQPVPVPTGQNIPEPGTFVLMGLGALALLAVRRVKR